MEVAFTFGSLGDIKDLSQLTIQLGQAVGIVSAASRGASAREYQDLRQDLDLFVHVLKQVVATYQEHELTPDLHELDAASKKVVDNCTTLIQDALNHLQAYYGTSLTKEGSGNKARDLLKRVEWCVREKTRLGTLRAALQEGIQKLTLLSNLSASKSARIANTTLLARIDQVQQICQDNHHQVLQMLEEQRLKSIEQQEEMEGLSDIKRQLDATEMTSRTAMSNVEDALQGLLEIKDLVVSLSQTVVNLQATASPTHCMRGLDPKMITDPSRQQTKPTRNQPGEALSEQTTSVISIPAEPGDFQPVRLLHVEGLRPSINAHTNHILTEDSMQMVVSTSGTTGSHSGGNTTKGKFSATFEERYGKGCRLTTGGATRSSFIGNTTKGDIITSFEEQHGKGFHLMQGLK